MKSKDLTSAIDLTSESLTSSFESESLAVVHHVEFEPKSVSDFNVRLGLTVFHLHKFKLHSCCVYFQTLFDAKLPEHDAKTCRKTPTLKLPSNFLSSKLEAQDDRVAIVEQFFNFVYDEAKAILVTQASFPSFTHVDAFCYVVHYFDCNSVERRLVSGWVDCVSDRGYSEDDQFFLGFSMAIPHQYHLSQVTKAAIRRLKQLYPTKAAVERSAAKLKEMMELVDDIGCLRSIFLELLKV